MNKTLRNLLIAAGSALALIVVLVLVLPFIIPLDSYRGRIEAAAGDATGRSFKIDGPLRLTFFPHFGVKAKEVTLANVPGGRAAVMVSVGDIDLSVKVLPLFSGKVALDKIVLEQPTIALEVDKDGNPNWQFGKETANKKGESKKGTLTLPAGTEFSGIEITDGKVTYDNAKTGTHRALEHVNIAVAITTADRPITATGDMALSGKKLSFAAKLETLQSFLSSGTTTFELKADAELMKASVNGSMFPDGTVNGRLNLDSPSFRGLAAWLGTKLPAGGLNDLKLSSQIANKDKVTRLENLNVTLDRQTIRGHLMVDARAKVPVLEGELDADRLDLNPYMSGGGKPTATGTAKPARPTGKSAGWSKKPISLALLKEFNGKLILTTGSLRAQGIQLGRTALRIENRDGFLTAWLDQISLYGGGGKAQLNIDARGAVPQFANTVDIRGVQLKPLLNDSIGLDSIEGTGTLTLDIRMAGASPYAILHSLSGKGALTGANGRIRGVDLGAVARTVQTALGSNATGDVASTTFHSMGASFVLANGVLDTKDFRLAGPVVQMTGQGKIDIGNRGIDFRLRPAAGVAGINIGIPFRITGTWDKLHYGPDLAELIGGVVNSFKSGGAAIGNLFGGGNKGDKNAKNGQKKKSTSDQLKNMFGIH